MSEDKETKVTNFGLNERQKKYCDLLRADPTLNQTQAYLRAYPACKSKVGAMSSASELRKNVKVVAYLASFDKEITEETGLTQEMIIKDLIKLKNMCLGDTASPLATITKDGEVVQEMVYKLDSAGAKGALEVLAKHKKMLTGNIDVGEQLIVHMHIDLDSKSEDLPVSGEKPQPEQPSKPVTH